MSEVPYTPTRVTLFARMSGAPEPAAEFRLDPTGEVTLHVVDERFGDLARRYHEQGAPSERLRRAVPRRQGADFMRTLLESRPMSYYEWVDTSDRPAS